MIYAINTRLCKKYKLCTKSFELVYQRHVFYNIFEYNNKEENETLDCQSYYIIYFVFLQESIKYVVTEGVFFFRFSFLLVEQMAVQFKFFVLRISSFPSVLGV